MFVLIGGGGRTGTQLALLLLAQNHRVHLIEHRRDVLARLHRELPSEVIYEGYATDLSVLEQARIADADVVAACTAEDADNLALCYIARERYRVQRVVGRINDPRNAWLFDQKFHVDVALNQAEMIAGLIVEEMSMGDMVTLLKLRRGQYALVDEVIPEKSRVLGTPLKDLNIPAGCVIAAIIRKGVIVTPRGATLFEPGDEMLAVTDSAGARQLAELFAPA